MHEMAYIVFVTKSSWIAGVTTNKDLATSRVNELNQGWEMSGDNRPPYALLEWPITNTAEDLINAGQIKEDLRRAGEAIALLDRLDPQLRQEVLNHFSR